MVATIKIIPYARNTAQTCINRSREEDIGIFVSIVGLVPTTDMASSLFHLHTFSNRLRYLGCVRTQLISNTVFSRCLSTPPKGEWGKIYIYHSISLQVLEDLNPNKRRVNLILQIRNLEVCIFVFWGFQELFLNICNLLLFTSSH